MWDRYGNWDEIAASGDADHIMKRITGRPLGEWGPNVVSDGLNAMLKQIARSSNRAAPSVVDFGCGVGRNARMLARYFDHLYAIDRPEMLAIFAEQDPCDAKGCYVALLPELAAASGHFDCVFDSVVFQHIVDADFHHASAATIQASQGADWVVSLFNAKVDRPLYLALLAGLGWRERLAENDLETFRTSPHRLVVLSRT